MSLVCDNCGLFFRHESELGAVFPRIHRLLERIAPGEIVPSGECPSCGSLVHIRDEDAVECNVCSDYVGLVKLREHLMMHNPNAANMSWEQVRAVFS